MATFRQEKKISNFVDPINMWNTEASQKSLFMFKFGYSITAN